MNVLEDATARLSAALDGISGVRHYRQLWGPVDPPAAVLALASFTMGAYGPEPTEASFRVALVAPGSDRSFQQLLELYERVVEAIDAVEDAVVRSGDTRPYSVAGVDYPALVFDVDVAL